MKLASNQNAQQFPWQGEPWFEYLGPKQQQLVLLAFQLLEREKELQSNFIEYAFIVFPMSKAYEGFLKQYFFELALIDTGTFEGKRFRVGRALNPDIRRSQRDEFWLYDDLEHLCGEPMARELWETWLECRNRVFHFFPAGKEPTVTLERAETLLNRVREAMEQAVACYDGSTVVAKLKTTLTN